MKFWNRYIEKKIREYIDSVIVIDKIDKERCKYKVEVSGVRVDDLISPPEEIPFEDTQYFIKQKDAIDFGKISVKDGNKAEVWKLIRRLE